ncbi:MAG: hypothetical protein A2785_03610 [Candidatus Chisholmbacteria bacterium RIFCSPHIGHO2_01_FULL_49_18]|uniref:DUF4012 domain-containing protein n=2 Tax=Candidatus Chisholmiibacteriota TaxID=1817900 RepID=A0A1G1VN47_9BACT|nr:MAG: hypothetical protein A2785_03610 [Candidatus Chisholmbacteria bacterium RIFCSPHIGHO2_01_FULL_49_18]OGY19481.1 MAG: hypothetical protein A3A65_06250 [Candidatus Chisholmbacteria bacterium RIFCSPLOWO2_01_FULL_49_14]
MKKHSRILLHQVVSEEGYPTAVIFSREGFVSSYLAQKLLELPLRLIVMSPIELEEIKHLQGNERFQFLRIENPEDILQGAIPNVNYIFQIVDSGEKQESEVKEKLIKLANDQEAKLIQVESLYSYRQALRLLTIAEPVDGIASSHTSALTPREDDSCRVIFLHAYGPKMQLSQDWALSRFLRAIEEEKSLPVEGDGLAPLYPIYIEDAVKALVKVMFSKSKTERMVIIAGKEEVSSLNVGYKLREILLKKTGKLFEIVFSDRGELRDSLGDRAIVKNAIQKTSDDLGWGITTNLMDGLTKTLDWAVHADRHKRQHLPEPQSPKQSKRLQGDPEPESQLVTGAVSSVPQSQEERAEPKKRHAWDMSAFKPKLIKKKNFVALFAVLLILFCAPVFFFTFTIVAGVVSLRQAMLDLQTAEIDQALVLSEKSNSLFSRAQGQVVIASNIIQARSIGGKLQIIQEYLEIGQLISQAVHQSARLAMEGKEAKQIILNQSNHDLESVVFNMNAQLHSLVVTLARVELSIAAGGRAHQALLPFGFASGLDSTISEIPKLRRLVSDLTRMFDILPHLLGKEGKNTYLVVLQNNAELRPTGGFIGSYALVTFDKFRLLDWKVEDVYAADGQLKGHVEPPAEIKEYLGEEGWYLRDSNWDPDFPSAARQIEWFFEKETGVQVDGTIAMNLFVIQDLLRVFGPIDIPDYEQAITAENLFEKAQFRSEMNFFPGSTQKKDFLGSVGKNLFFAIEQSEPQDLAKFAASLIRSLQKGQLLLAVNDAGMAQTIQNLGWDGSLKDVKCAPQNNEPCIKTYLALREANVGVNKANYYIKRALNVSQVMEDGKVTTQLTINLQNLGNDSVWPSGSYKNYLRIYTNPENRITAVSINGNELENQRLTLTVEHGKQVVGLLVDVPIQEEKEIAILMEMDMPERSKQGISSSILIQKQPGTENDSLTLELSAPKGMSIEAASLPLQNVNGTASLTQPFIEDLSLQVEFKGQKVIE